MIKRQSLNWLPIHHPEAFTSSTPFPLSPYPTHSHDSLRSSPHPSPESKKEDAKDYVKDKAGLEKVNKY